MNRMALLGMSCLVLAGCTTTRGEQPNPVFENLNLMEMNGRAVGQNGLTLTLFKDSTYTAQYDCDDRFGRYQYEGSGRITFEPEASSGKVCDQVDLRTGKIVAQKSQAAEAFFADPNFSVEKNGQSWRFINRSHTFVFRKSAEHR